MQRSWAEDEDSAPPPASGHLPCKHPEGTERMISAVRRRVYVHCAGPAGARHARHRHPWRR